MMYLITAGSAVLYLLWGRLLAHHSQKYYFIFISAYLFIDGTY